MSILKRSRLQELMKMDEALRMTRLGVQMAERLSQEALLHTQRLANQGRGEGPWNHALVERRSHDPNSQMLPRREVWIIFRPGDPLASTFHSYSYWEKHFLRGDTILCSGKMMSWNLLTPHDTVLLTISSEKLSMTEWEMQNLITKTAKKFGI